MISYRTAPELHRHRDLGFTITFGISAYHRGKRLLHIPDVFCHRRQAVEFVRRCNQHRLELCHMRDLLEDEM